MVSGSRYNLENPMNFVPSESCFTANIKPEKHCQFFNDNQLLFESSLAIPVECLSRKSMCIIVNALIEELQSAKSRIVELELKYQNGFMEDFKNEIIENSCGSYQSVEDSSQRHLLENKTIPQTTAATSMSNNSRRAVEKPSTDELLCRFCSYRHQRGKANCPAQNKICERCNLPNHFAFTCKTNLKKEI